MGIGFKKLDIGHNKFSLDTALSVLETEISKLQFGGGRCVKIIHGHGRGALRAAVRSWCCEQEGRVRAVIFGEDYDIFHNFLSLYLVTDKNFLLEHLKDTGLSHPFFF